MNVNSSFRLLLPSRRAWLLKILISAAILTTIAGCQGEKGPAGIQGPPGQSLDLTVEIIGSYPVLRADGLSNTTIDVKVSTIAGNNVAGIEVTFRVVSGGGSVSPSVVTTDETGTASCKYTAGTQSGTAVVSASISRSELTITDTRELSIDPLTVSPPLLSSDFNEPLMGQWSHDGSFIIFQTWTYNDFGIYKVSAQGGDPVHFGSYRGGACKPDGSGRIAVYEPPSGNWPEDSKMFIMDYDGQLVGSGFRPSGFSGDMRAVCWCQDGDSLLIASNTNALYYVCALNGEMTRSFDTPFWARTLSSVPNSPYVVVSGSGEDSGGIYSMNLVSGSFEQLVIGDDWYSSDPQPNISGASVNAQGTTVVYSARKKTAEGYRDHNDLYTVPFEGGQPQELLASSAEELQPVWSPDGTKVLFTSNRSGFGYNLYVYTISQ